MSRYKETTGYLVHQRNFLDSSLIVEFFSQDFGMMHIIAKGIKKNKNLKPQLQPFSLLKLQYFGKAQLKTMSACNIITSLQLDELILKTAGLYLNELLRYSLIENEPAVELFSCYEQTMAKLGKQRLTPLLRNFEKQILKHNGFELNVSGFEDEKEWLTINETKGLTLAKNKAQMLCQVKDLQSFINLEILDIITQRRINKFMLCAIDMNFSFRKIYSRDLLKEIFKKIQ